MAAIRKHPPKNSAATIQDLAAKGHSIIGIAKALGVGRETFKRWCEEDDTLQEAFEIGREVQRQALIAAIYASAMGGKAANVNAFFLLKTMHGFREGDPQNVQVEVKVSNVLKVTDHGTNEEWAAKAAEQQRKLTLDAQSPRVAPVPELPAPVEATEQGSSLEAAQSETAPSWLPPLPSVPQPVPAYPLTPEQRDYVPTWKAKA